MEEMQREEAALEEEEEEVMDTEMEERGEVVASYPTQMISPQPVLPRAPQVPAQTEAANNLASIFALVMDSSEAKGFSQSLLSEYTQAPSTSKRQVESKTLLEVDSTKKEKEKEKESDEREERSQEKEKKIAKRKAQRVALATTFQKIVEGKLQALDPDTDLLAPFLPNLVRLAIEVPKFSWLFSKLSSLPQTNAIKLYLQEIDFEVISASLADELQQKRKLYSQNVAEGSMTAALGDDVISEFENGNEQHRMRIFLSEMHNVIAHVQRNAALIEQAGSNSNTIQKFAPYDSEILCDEIYLSELSVILPIATIRCKDYLPIEALISALFCLEMGKELIKCLFLNMPYATQSIIDILIQCSSHAPEKVSEILLEVCSLSRLTALSVRSRLVKQHILPGLALQLTLKFIHDEVTFLSGLLSDPGWMEQYINQNNLSHQSLSGKSSPVHKMRKKLLNQMRGFESETRQPEKILTTYQRIQLCALLRLYCGLTGLMKMKLNAVEMNTILEVLTRAKQERIVKLGLCWVLACEGLLNLCDKKDVSNCLNSMLQSGHCLELLLLISIHFHTSQLSSVVELVKDTLGLPVMIHSESLNQMGEVFTRMLFTEEVVAKQAVALPPTPKLSANETSIAIMCVYHLLKNKIFTKHRVDVSDWIYSQILQSEEPIHPLLPALLEEWVKSIMTPSASFCMRKLSKNKLLRVFIREGPQQQQPVSEKGKEKMDIDKKDKKQKLHVSSLRSLPAAEDLTSNRRAGQTLALYYVLFYNAEVLHQSIEDKNKPRTTTPKQALSMKATAYSTELVESLPTKALLSYIQSHANDSYSNIYPPLLNLIVSQFPGLLTVVNILNEEDLKTNTIRQFVDEPLFNYISPMDGFGQEQQSELSKEEEEKQYIPFTRDCIVPFMGGRLDDTAGTDAIISPPNVTTLTATFANTLKEPIKTTFALMQLSSLKRSSQQLYTEALIQTLLPLLLEDPEKLHEITNQFGGLWESLYTQIPFELALMTMNAIAPKQPDGDDIIHAAVKNKKPQTTVFKHMDLVLDPLLILTCDQRIFRIPRLFKILLMILNLYMVESHKHLNTQMSTEPTGSAKQEELNTLLYAQDSGIVQMLLELCLDSKDCAQGCLEEIRIEVCGFLHQIFIEAPLLIKLVHFQGYPPELLPVTVEGIPSMHICLEYIPELLAQPQVDKQIFAIQLAGYLVEKYPLTRSLEIAKMIIGKLRVIHSNLGEEEPSTFLLQVLSSLTQLVKAFPSFLLSDAINLLLRLYPSAGSSSLPSTLGLSEKNPQLESKIISTFLELVEKIKSTDE